MTPGIAQAAAGWADRRHLGWGHKPMQQRNERWAGQGGGQAMTIPAHEGGHAWVGTVVLAQGALSTGWSNEEKEAP